MSVASSSSTALLRREKASASRALKAASQCQNIPAVLNDPTKGKQRDFFTRSWGETFVDYSGNKKGNSSSNSNSSSSSVSHVAPSPHLHDVSVRAFDKYLKKVRHYEHKRRGLKKSRSLHTEHVNEQEASVVLATTANVDSTALQKNVSSIFFDPDFDLSRPETFAAVFQIETFRGSELDFIEKVKSTANDTQERLSHQLDEVEVSIAHQVAQKSQQFFQVMSYHDALSTQLTSLVSLIQGLRGDLKSHYASTVLPVLAACHHHRRRSRLVLLQTKLGLMHSLHETKPTIQSLLQSNEFSGALDLIHTSCEILAVDLNGMQAFKHFRHELREVEMVIGRMLLEDFQAFVAKQIKGKDTIHVKATSLKCMKNVSLDDLDLDRLKSVIFGLIRQNSFQFLEALEDASVSALKATLRDVVINVLNTAGSKKNDDEDNEDKTTTTGTTITALVIPFASRASSEEWIDLIDILVGSVMVLLHRIHHIHTVIQQAVETVENGNVNDGNDINNTNVNVNSNGTVAIPKTQLQTLRSSSAEVLINVCDQMHERCAKVLSHRSRCADLITVHELASLGLIVSIFSEDTMDKSGKISNSLQLSLQSQSVLLVQHFDDVQRRDLINFLEQEENWTRTKSDLTPVTARLAAIPTFAHLVNKQNESNNAAVGTSNGLSKGKKESSRQHHSYAQLRLRNGSKYTLSATAPFFLRSISDYCNLATMLGSVSLELGLKLAELVKCLCSRICQLLIGLGAIQVAGLKTISVLNMAIAIRDVECIQCFLPSIVEHFESCHSAFQTESMNNNNVNSSNNVNKRIDVRLETLRKQFSLANTQMSNLRGELRTKIIAVADNRLRGLLGKWDGSGRVPSSTFKSVCRQITKLYESIDDVMEEKQKHELLLEVHRGFCRAFGEQFGGKKRPNENEKRALQAEIVFYAQSITKLEPEDKDQFGQETLQQDLLTHL